MLWRRASGIKGKRRKLAFVGREESFLVGEKTVEGTGKERKKGEEV